MGKLVDQHMNVFHIETALNNRMFHSATAFLGKNEDEFTEVDRLKFEAMRWTLSKLPAAAKRKMFHSIPAPYQLIACARRQDRAGARPGDRRRTSTSTWSACAGRATS